MQLTGKSIDTVKFFYSRVKLKYNLLFFSSLIVGFFEAVSTLAIYPVIKYADPQNTGKENETLQKLIDLGSDLFSTTPLKISIYFLVAITLVKLLLLYGNNLFAWIVSNKLVQNLRVELIENYLKMNYEYVLNAERGDFTYRVMQAPGFVSKCMNNLVKISIEIFKIIMIFLSLLLIDKTITLIILMITIVYLIINFIITRNISYGTGSDRAKSAAKQVSHSLNIIGGHKSIRLFGVIEFWVSKFKKEVMNFYRIALKDTLIGDLPKYFFELIIIIILAAFILIYSGRGASISEFLPTIGVFTVALLRVMPSIKIVGMLNRTFMADLPNAEATYLALNEMSLQSSSHSNGNRIVTFRDKILFDKVVFAYSGLPVSVLNKVTFSIDAGEFVGITGESGSGKTTILDLLTNLLKPQSGNILIDGHPVKNLNQKSLSKLIGYVGQDPFFFNGTIRENLLFGRSGFSDIDIENALAKAELLDFIKSKHDYLDFSLADSGLKISGGQRQRLNLTRALLGKPQILILDEATSNLDTSTEARIVNTIIKLVQEQKITIIFVTHRMSAIKNADKIIKLENGLMTTVESNLV